MTRPCARPSRPFCMGPSSQSKCKAWLRIAASRSCSCKQSNISNECMSNRECAHTWRAAMSPDIDNRANATAEGGRQATAHAQTPRVPENATPL
eukprot:6134342-Pleurochrysis_carterae.AAC.1